MKTVELLDLDCRTEEGKQKLNDAVRRIGNLKNIKYPTIEDIEDAIGYMCRKYRIMVQHICPTYTKGEINIYSASIKTTDSFEWLGNVYGYCLYELMCKTAIKIYTEIKKGTVNEYENKQQ